MKLWVGGFWGDALVRNMNSFLGMAVAVAADAQGARASWSPCSHVCKCSGFWCVTTSKICGNGSGGTQTPAEASANDRD